MPVIRSLADVHGRDVRQRFPEVLGPLLMKIGRAPPELGRRPAGSNRPEQERAADLGEARLRHRPGVEREPLDAAAEKVPDAGCGRGSAGLVLNLAEGELARPRVITVFHLVRSEPDQADALLRHADHQSRSAPFPPFDPKGFQALAWRFPMGPSGVTPTLRLVARDLDVGRGADILGGSEVDEAGSAPASCSRRRSLEPSRALADGFAEAPVQGVRTRRRRLSMNVDFPVAFLPMMTVLGRSGARRARGSGRRPGW